MANITVGRENKGDCQCTKQRVDKNIAIHAARLTNETYQKVTMPKANKVSSEDDMRWREIPKEATESFWQAEDGWEIRRIDWPPLNKGMQRGSLLFLPGRGDHYEKYLETLHYWAQQGWHVTSIDWRGQGLSGRVLPNHNIGYIADFSIWIADLRFFWQQWQAENSGPHVLVAHSMGGHLALRALAEGAVDPVAIALSAPMLGVRSNGLPLSWSRAFAKLMLRIGYGKRPAWKDKGLPEAPIMLRQKLLTHSDRRYEDEFFWWNERPDVRLGPPSWRWLERAFSSTAGMRRRGKLEEIESPVLLLATKFDQLVSTKRIVMAHERLPNSQLHNFGIEAAHELLRESDGVRDECLRLIEVYFDKHAPNA